MTKALTETEQAALALADFFTHEAMPDADAVCAQAAGILAQRNRGQRGDQAFALHTQHLAASLVRNSGALDSATPKAH